jgi:hypothetical protein
MRGLPPGTIIAALALVVPSSPALADDEEAAPRTATQGVNGGEAVAGFDVTSAFTEAFRHRLAGGLTSRVVIEMTLVDENDLPLGYSVRECQLRMDVWDDVLYVLIRDANRPAIRKKLLLIDEGLKSCGQVDKAVLADFASVPRRPSYRLAVAVSLNPVSSELLQHTREFMANPNDTRPGNSTSFFGTVARLFISKPNMGGERFVFRSGPLPRPTRSP